MFHLGCLIPYFSPSGRGMSTEQEGGQEIKERKRKGWWDGGKCRKRAQGENRGRKREGRDGEREGVGGRGGKSEGKRR